MTANREPEMSRNVTAKCISSILVIAGTSVGSPATHQPSARGALYIVHVPQMRDQVMERAKKLTTWYGVHKPCTLVNVVTNRWNDSKKSHQKHEEIGHNSRTE